ncbi:hypothetical protein GE061_002173 [Apolygus lucorum]|uniref:Uncharacterized protein n=1 Tax=Apolygus lucorum TaxID=248454 RepID=A0A8S9X628_APOLU|nr:hypothetical protein GE061_002173 [Apolygus lucorum]
MKDGGSAGISAIQDHRTSSNEPSLDHLSDNLSQSAPDVNGGRRKRALEELIDHESEDDIVVQAEWSPELVNPDLDEWEQIPTDQCDEPRPDDAFIEPKTPPVPGEPPATSILDPQLEDYLLSDNERGAAKLIDTTPSPAKKLMTKPGGVGQPGSPNPEIVGSPLPLLIWTNFLQPAHYVSAPRFVRMTPQENGAPVLLFVPGPSTKEPVVEIVMVEDPDEPPPRYTF